MNKNDLQHKISAFFTDVVPVVVFYGFDKFIGFFNDIAPQ
jgi:hypothetical protein